MLATRRETYQQLGGLNPEFRELALIDYCLRATDTGQRIVIVPDARLLTTGPDTTTNDLPAIWRLRQSWARPTHTTPTTTPTTAPTAATSRRSGPEPDDPHRAPGWRPLRLQRMSNRAVPDRGRLPLSGLRARLDEGSAGSNWLLNPDGVLGRALLMPAGATAPCR